MAIRIDTVLGGWKITEDVTGREGIATTPAQVAKRVRELLADAPPHQAADVDEAGMS